MKIYHTVEEEQMRTGSRNRKSQDTYLTTGKGQKLGGSQVKVNFVLSFVCLLFLLRTLNHAYILRRSQ